ncbi:hypothetical protein G5T09_04015 [Legionella pneumophila serogroup 1]|uniref:Uncharacterized protein n=1 Tax=Legionella pneumophila TaxID=446 RepID=A0A128HGV2_LEGPN|nr:hypothetical protein [Legionella pneumophila]ABQ56101.1 hypothetical protein LPC_2174 [Legionella pneumophila str. Corby]ADG24452.1 hypothetical protein lpa_01680 [Legionella pneumophila 2300/99 Alcoy]MCH9059015.1 hypothetical protein [Legionella pneumophila serogroup 1]MCH9062842.1 hypothetical protein [Legionella pneumophila serogroup 1]MCH9065047.1 hypothetical protein [Legionella pneumophila serogroup 1]
MYLVKLGMFMVSILLAFTLRADPGVDIIQSCKNMKAAKNTIVMKELDGFGFNEKNEANCQNQFDSKIEGAIYGAVVCDDKSYFIINNKKISTESAKNLSMNESVKPNIPIHYTSMWWKIEDGDKSWLCVVSPLSDTGSAANSLQYYLIENAFESPKNLALYFYFFDKNVHKRFS